MTEKNILIRYPEGRIILNLPTAFEKMSITTQKKIFKILLDKEWYGENRDTVRQIDEFITEWIDDWQQQWDDASRFFRNNYRDPLYNGKTEKEQKRITRDNNEFLKDVKTAKKRHDRALKVQAAWTKLKDKHLKR